MPGSLAPAALSNQLLQSTSSGRCPVWTEQRPPTKFISCRILTERWLFSYVPVSSPLPTRIRNQSNLWPGTPVPKKASRQLHANQERLYPLEQKISAGDGFSRHRAL